MKKFLFAIAIILVQIVCTVNLSSCQELNIDSQNEYLAKIEVDARSEYSVLAMNPADIVFNISSNIPWRVKSEQAWCAVSPSMSASSSLVETITVHLENNETEEARTAVLTIEADGTDEVTLITIVQDSKGTLQVQPATDIIATAGGSVTFTLVSNKPWTVTSDSQWLTFDKAEGTGTGEVEAITASGTDNQGARRTAIVTVATALDKKTFELTQDGVSMSIEEVTEPGGTLFAGTGEKEAKTYTVVSTTTAWKPVTDADWITLEKISDTQFTVKVLKSNPYFAARKGNITLEPTFALMPELVVPPLVITQNAFWAKDNAGTSSITVNEDGSVTLKSVDKNKCRMYTGDAADAPLYKLGTYIWTFSNINFADPAYFDINFYSEDGGPRFELFLGEAHANAGNRNIFGSWGDNGWWSESKFDLSLDELNEIKTLKIEFIRDPANTSNLKLTVWLNERELASITKPDSYALNPGKYNGNKIYFGFNGYCADAEVTIKSFEIQPVE